MIRDKLHAIWEILTCSGFYLVTRQGPEREPHRRGRRINIDCLKRISSDACDIAKEHYDLFEGQEAVNQANKILNK